MSKKVGLGSLMRGVITEVGRDLGSIPVDTARRMFGMKLIDLTPKTMEEPDEVDEEQNAEEITTDLKDVDGAMGELLDTTDDSRDETLEIDSQNLDVHSRFENKDSVWVRDEDNNVESHDIFEDSVVDTGDVVHIDLLEVDDEDDEFLDELEEEMFVDGDGQTEEGKKSDDLVSIDDLDEDASVEVETLDNNEQSLERVFDSLRVSVKRAAEEKDSAVKKA